MLAVHASKSDPIWLICQVFHPDTQSTSQLLSEAFHVLADRGQAFIVISGYPAVPAAPHAPSRENWNGIEIRRGGLRNQFKRSLLRRALSYAAYSWFVCWQLILAKRGRRVLAVTNPPYHPALVAFVCRWKRHSLTLLLQDIYPEGLVAVGRMKRAGLMARSWHRANRIAFGSAREIWVLGRDMATLVQQDYGIAVGKIQVVPHWSLVEADHLRRAEDTRLFNTLQLEGKFVVQYSGNMGLWHDLDTIVLAAAALQDERHIHFVLIGAGIKRAAAEKRSAELGLRNVTWLPYQKRDELSDTLACCHAALISQRSGLEGIAVPCKLYGILSAGRAVVAQVPTSSEVGMVVREEACGAVVPPGDVSGLVAVILELAAKPAEAERMGRQAFLAYRTKYTLSRAVETFEDHFSRWSLPRSPQGESVGV
jgi:glycosyltransferase involved in cell wall biosynthesis